MNGLLRRRWPYEDRGTQGKWYVKTETEIVMMHLQAEEHQRLPAKHQKLARGKEGFFYRFQREQSLTETLILDI